MPSSSISISPHRTQPEATAINKFSGFTSRWKICCSLRSEIPRDGIHSQGVHSHGGTNYPIITITTRETIRDLGKAPYKPKWLCPWMLCTQPEYQGNSHLCKCLDLQSIKLGPYATEHTTNSYCSSAVSRITLEKMAATKWVPFELWFSTAYIKLAMLMFMQTLPHHVARTFPGRKNVAGFLTQLHVPTAVNAQGGWRSWKSSECWSRLMTDLDHSRFLILDVNTGYPWY